ncbi:M12 family metallo-peptidase [Sphingomonas sp. LB2R24]|uniref:M12 family metallo-peptidase n=1 Tax=Sphingomonas sorbitolis TaxID=3096165 RepID=UPI002FCBEA6C
MNGEVDDLFENVPERDDHQSAEDLLGPHGLRARLVRISQTSFRGSPAAALRRVHLNFFPADRLGVLRSGALGEQPIELIALLQQPRTENGDTVVLGRLEDDQDSWLTMVMVGETFALTLNSLEHGLFEVVVRNPESDLYVARKLDEGLLPDCGVPDAASSDDDEGSESGASADDGGADAAAEAVVIDLMVVYTPAARDRLKTDDAVRARALESVARGNQVLANSGLDVRLKLVHCALLPGYAEPSGADPFYVMLAQLEKGIAPGLEGLHALRKTHKADIVSLLVADNSLGGLANVIGEPPRATFGRAAYNVVYYQVAASTWTLLHEIGHNLGACHESPCVTRRPYGQGHAFAAGAPPRQYKTVMVRKSVAGQRIPYFSSADVAVTYRNVPVGDGSHDNARVVRAGAPIASTFGEAL